LRVQDIITEKKKQRRKLMEQKVVLITGGTRGIGFASTRKFAEKGCLVAINGNNEERGIEAVKELKEEGYTAVYFKADVTKEMEVEMLI